MSGELHVLEHDLALLAADGPVGEYVAASAGELLRKWAAFEAWCEEHGR